MRKIRVLVLTGGGYHDFGTCGEILEQFLTATDWFKVTRTDDRDAIRADYLSRFDALLVFTQGDGLAKKQVSELEAWVRKGGALVGLHCASDSFRKHRSYVEILGAEFSTHGPVHKFMVDPTDEDHTIARRIPSFEIEDELYVLQGDSSRWTTLMTANWKGKKEPMVYVREEEKGKICYLALGHGEEAFRNPNFQKLTIRALRWASGGKEKPAVRCGVIGYGGAFNMGKAHADMMVKAPGLEIVAVCDVDRSRTAAAKQDFPHVATFTSLKRMLAMDELDLVTLVTPHHIHAAQSVEASRAGKHVVTEKPMCITAKQATEMVQAAKKSGAMLSVFHNRRWDGDYKALRKIVESGQIGEVFQVDVFSGGYGHPGWWWRSDKRISGGCLYDWGAHFVDWILNLVPSPVDSVTGFFQKLHWHGVTNEDHTVAIIRFTNGAMANLEQTHLAAAEKDRWRVLGTKGAVRRGGRDDFWTVIRHDGAVRITSQVPFEKEDWLAYYMNVADHLVMDEELEVKGEEGRRVIGVIETAEKSSKQRKSLPVPYEKK